MKVLIYRYGSICEPDVISGFQELGCQVSEITEEIHNKTLKPSDSVKLISQYLMNHPQDFVFSINFFPVLSYVCNIFKIPYLCWSVDSPVLEFFSKSIQNACNRIFLFDRIQYNEIAPLNPGHVFHLPLAANVTGKQRVIQNASSNDMIKFSSDVSFIGSLYTEKCPYNKLDISSSSYLAGYLNGIMESQLRVYGYYFIDDLLSDSVIEEFKHHMPGFYSNPSADFLTDRMTISQLYIGSKITELERLRTMELISSQFSFDLYTGSDTSSLPLVHNKGLAKTMTEMPIIFHNSKINLNTTSKSIRSGLPLRIFDILACGGFVLTNYQSELPELFDIGQELVAYGSMEEMLDLTTYYLEHDKKRNEIAHAGYEKVLQNYTYPIRLEQMLRLSFNNY